MTVLFITSNKEEYSNHELSLARCKQSKMIHFLVLFLRTFRLYGYKLQYSNNKIHNMQNITVIE